MTENISTILSYSLYILIVAENFFTRSIEVRRNSMILFILTAQILFLLPRTIRAEDDNLYRFPKGFKIGAAGSAYQIEGGWNLSGKSPSTWDTFTHQKNHLIYDRSNGDIACDSYHKYKEDIQIVKDIGFTHYRLSLSWSRILPSGFHNKISKDGIQYYKNLLNELSSNGIEPYVTLYHWDHPESIEEMGGWLNELIVEYFVDYARVVFEELGSQVKFWTTLNEPNVECSQGYEKGDRAPGLQILGKGAYICGHNMLKAHARVYRMYDEEFRKTQNGMVGLVASCPYYYPLDPSDTESSEVAFQFSCGWFYHPIHSKNGDYPKVMKDRINERSKLEGYGKSRLPTFSTHWIEYIKGTYDYIGLNHYTSMMSEFSSVTNFKPGYFFDDSGVHTSKNQSWPTSVSSWLHVVPQGMGDVLRKIKKEYNNPPVYILENGVSTDDKINDVERIDYLSSYMKEMLIAINRDKCDVKAYTIWSLLDNFEWERGYTERFGIVHVDFTDPNRKRSPKKSVSWIKNVIANQTLVERKKISPMIDLPLIL